MDWVGKENWGLGKGSFRGQGQGHDGDFLCFVVDWIRKHIDMVGQEPPPVQMKSG